MRMPEGWTRLGGGGEEERAEVEEGVGSVHHPKKSKANEKEGD